MLLWIAVLGGGALALASVFFMQRRKGKGPARRSISELPPGPIPAFPPWTERPDLPQGMYTSGHLWHFDGRAWSHHTPNDAEPIEAIYGDHGHIYTAGWNQIWHFDGHTLQPEGQDLPRLFGIWGSEAHHVYAVGTGGTILHSRGDGHWQREPSQTTSGLSAIWGTAAQGIYATGWDGTILHSTGDGLWTPQPSGVEAHLSAIWGDENRVVVGGDDGIVLSSRHDGRWAQEKVPTTGSVAALWGRAGRLYAVTNIGQVLASDRPGRWRVLLHIDRQLCGLWGLSEDWVYAVGLQGCLLEGGAGQPWQNSSGSPSLGVNAIFATGPDNLWLGGSDFVEIR